MKIIQGFNGSAVRVNDDQTLDYCLSNLALSELGEDEYAFVINKEVADCKLNEPIYAVFRTQWQDEGFAPVTYNEDFADFKRQDGQEETVVNPKGQLFIPDSMTDILDVDINTKKDAEDLAKYTIEKINKQSSNTFRPTTSLLDYMIEEALEIATWQTLETVFDDCVFEDMLNNPELYLDHQ